jgi:hypothetical protein
MNKAPAADRFAGALSVPGEARTSLRAPSEYATTYA